MTCLNTVRPGTLTKLKPSQNKFLFYVLSFFKKRNTIQGGTLFKEVRYSSIWVPSLVHYLEIQCFLAQLHYLDCSKIFPFPFFSLSNNWKRLWERDLNWGLLRTRVNWQYIFAQKLVLWKYLNIFLFFNKGSKAHYL